MIPIAQPVIDQAAVNAISAVLSSGKLAQGEQVKSFEGMFASYCGTKYAVATSNGTNALQLALLASEIEPGDEVITTPFSFVASANSILYCQAKPIFADIDPLTFNIDPKNVERLIGPRTRAILGVHLYGQPFDVNEILSLCSKHNLAFIEDACQAHGAEYHGQRVGSFGIGCFSFYPTKNMTTGEGGMMTTNDTRIAEKASVLRNHGQRERYKHEMLGYNFRMTDIAAAIGITQLARLDEFNAKRIQNANYLSQAIRRINGLISPFVANGIKHVFHQYTIRVTSDYPISRDALKERLQEKGVSSAVHYPIPIHKQPMYERLGYSVTLPEAEKAASQVLSLPIHPSLTQSDLDTIIEALIYE
ncbi:perosamine synthase [Dehalogenimonas formicexedens]|uniref:Perosamine synthase n=1 Tax=Dehalogenimonas formicexedens TaxID=1839801 RepID=A0A1P8F9J1_9CHLR|nr:DegT/DnrJ/EryC1/StrS family aminotransferase [Dehalogenimonas formicexedens]APV45137.1 perosamine synthase [Dehalogenimonas formicexedens]